jgi:hypothetical protein
MNESFLHYIWQYQYFNKAELLTSLGEPIHIFSPGYRNSDAGPDFLNAKVRIGEMQWVGNVEIHIFASGWMQHAHNEDRAYDNVILHVVWKNDKPVTANDGNVLSTLELSERVDENLLVNYKNLISSVDEIPCAHSLPSVKRITLVSTLDRIMSSRLESKANEVLELLQRNRGDWEETAYQLLAKNFGFKVNSEPFFQLALSLPYKTLMKHSDKLLQLEALLFGVAGFLEDKYEDDYYVILQREYNLLRQKYRLDHKVMNKIQWKFLRLRPSNFPTLRLAQFASFLYNRNNIFSWMIESSLTGLFSGLENQPSPYWLRHFNFKKETTEKVGTPGRSSVENILVNTVVPLSAAFGKLKDANSYLERAVDILHSINPESNKVTRKWESVGLKSRHAFDSQAFIELYNNLCCRHRCLDCNIGASLIKPVKR